MSEVMRKKSINRKYRMISLYPATRWQDALPSGNGTIGALVYGNIRNELVVLNHEALWLYSEKPVLADISAHLLKLREMLAEEHYSEASNFLNCKLKENNCKIKHTDPYLPAFDMEVEMQTRSAFADYSRCVNFETGEVSVTWREKDTMYRRDLFVSRAHDVVVMRIQSSGSEHINCNISLKPRGLDNTWVRGSAKKIRLPEVLKTLEVSIEDTWISLRGHYDKSSEFGGLARVMVHDGEVKAKNQRICVNNTDEVLVLIKLFANENSNMALKRLQSEIEGLSPDYAQLLESHVTLHKELFLKMRLDLKVDKKRTLCNEQLLLDAYNGDVPIALIERMFDYGRYLLISSSRPGGWPANLQGVWNGDYNPAWSSDYHNDANIQINYWQALPGNIPEVTLPYFDFYEASVPDYRANAKNIFGCRGILAPIAQSTHGIIYDGVWINWTAAAGWLAQLFYDYWLFTGDRKFLKNRAVPFMKEVALFYEDFLFEGKDGKLIFSPSLSPENVPAIPHAALITINATMDVAIAKEVLSNLCEACELLGIEKENITYWRRIIKKLPDYELNEDGAIKEWIHPDLCDNYHHRHLSHIYPLFPGLEITKESNPDLFEACRIAVEKRLVIGLSSQMGFSLAHMANIYARLGNGNRALECLELLMRSCVGANLFTYLNDWRRQGLTAYGGHGSQPPFQIDANFGISAAVLEMLVSSKPGMIKLLPALPNKWRKGKAEGILCRSGIEVSMDWDMNMMQLQAVLISRTAQEVTVKFPASVTSLKCDVKETEITDSSYGDTYRVLKLPAGKEVSLWLKFKS